MIGPVQINISIEKIEMSHGFPVKKKCPMPLGLKKVTVPWIYIFISKLALKVGISYPVDKK